MMHVSQIIMLYTLNLYSAVCQLYLNKNRRKNKQPKTTFKKMLNMFNWNTKKKIKRERNRRNICSNNSLEFSKVIIDTKPQIQKAQRTPSKINTKKTTHKLIIIKLQKSKTFSCKILKEASEGKNHLIQRGKRIRITTNSSSETMQARR